MIEALHPWVQLRDVILLLAPIFLFSLSSAILIYIVFIVILPSSSRILTSKSSGSTQPGLVPYDSNPSTAGATGAVEPYIGTFSYLVLASLFGIILGMLVKLVGGFAALEKGQSNTLIGAIGSVLVIVLGIAGSMFAESGRLDIKKPVGAIAFLVSFLVSGFYWKLLETAGPHH